MQVLLSKGVEESKILFLSLIAAPAGIHQLCGKYPALKVVTSEIDQGLDETTFQVIPGKNLLLAFNVIRHNNNHSMPPIRQWY